MILRRTGLWISLGLALGIVGMFSGQPPRVQADGAALRRAPVSSWQAALSPRLPTNVTLINFTVSLADGDPGGRGGLGNRDRDRYPPASSCSAA